MYVNICTYIHAHFSLKPYNIKIKTVTYIPLSSVVAHESL